MLKETDVEACIQAKWPTKMNIQVINDHYIFEEHLMQNIIWQNLTRMIYGKLRVIHEYSI